MAQKAHRNECNEDGHKRDGASMRMRLDAKQATTARLMYMPHCNTRPKGSTTPSSTRARHPVDISPQVFADDAQYITIAFAIDTPDSLDNVTVKVRPRAFSPSPS